MALGKDTQGNFILEGEPKEYEREALARYEREIKQAKERFRREMSSKEREAFMEGMKFTYQLKGRREYYRRIRYRRSSNYDGISHDINSELSSLTYMHRKLKEKQS